MIYTYLNDSKVNISDSSLLAKLDKIKASKLPAFAAYRPDIVFLNKFAKKYFKYKNLIIIGRGGSTSSSESFWVALGKDYFERRAYFLKTNNPDTIESIKRRCSKDDTIVMPISKSGNTVDVIEDLMQFEGYKVVPITQGKGTLFDIVKTRNLDYLVHPEVGGRYSGGTECGLAPCAILGLDIEEIFKGMLSMWKKCDPKVGIEKNPALSIAATFYLLDKKGYDEIFMPVYSERLAGFIELVMQLIHESAGKEGKGQTLFGAEAPQSQHHTNQRFFGGKKNVVGLFLRVKELDHENVVTIVPKDLAEIIIDNARLSYLNGIKLSDALSFEFEGTQKNAVKLGIPNVVLTVDKITPYSVGELMALFQYVAVYYSMLLGVDPFDQPHVEGSKKISKALREGYSGNYVDGYVK